MTRLRIFLSRLWSLVRSRQMDREIDDEITSHLAEATDEYIEQGLSPEEARRAALRRFGGVTQTKEIYRHVRSFMSLDDLVRDLRHTVRTLRRSPGFTMVTVVTLALGIGATTAIFSVVNGVFLRPLPYPNAERLMQPLTIFAGGSQGSFSYPDFEDLRDQNRTFAGLAAYTNRGASAAMGEQGFRVGWTTVSPGFLSLIGRPPALGRGFTADEEQTGGPVAVISYGYWQNRLAGRSDFASQSVRVNEQSYAIIGVMPPGYDFPAGTDFWAPFRQPMGGQNRTARGYGVVGRLRDDVSVAAAQQDLSAIARRLKRLHGDGANMVDATVRPVMEQLAGRVRAELTVLIVASGALLLVACVNVANLMLARALARDRESAFRLALGAGPWRVARIFMVESLVLTIAGAGLGLALAIGGVAALLAQNTTQLPRTGEIGVDVRVLVFSLAVSLLAALVVSVFPALRAARRDPRDALADSQRIQGGSTATRRLSAGLVMAQIALTVVLLVGAGLVGRSVLKLLDEDPGYRTDGALVMDVWLPAENYSGRRTDLTAGDAYNAGYLERLMNALRMIPGVERVGGVNHFPLTDPLTPSPGSNGNYLLLNRPDEAVTAEDRARLFAASRFGNAQFRVASEDYFAAMGIPVIRGRVFDARDTRNAPHVAVISASLAEARWPGEDPLGRLIDFTGMDGDLRTFTIIGIVGDIQELGIGAMPQPIFYADQRQRPRRANEFHVVIQGRGDVAALTAAARQVARGLDPRVPVGFRTLREVVSAWIAQRQLVLVLLALFGVLALVLAATGVYGIVGYRAARRTREIGVRVTLGARAPDVVRLLVREGAMFAVGGVVIGLIVANGSTRLVASWLYGVGRADPTTFAAVAVAMIAVVLAASWIPAYRASRIDAMEALRHD